MRVKVLIKELKVNFKIPTFLQSDIDSLIDAINHRHPKWDFWWQEVYGSINKCRLTGKLTEEQAEILKKYYCLGGYREVMEKNDKNKKTLL